MNLTPRFLSPSQAARRLGVSPKALRLYKQRGLIVPARTPAGWRSYGPQEMVSAAEIVALRSLGLSIAQVAWVMQGDPQGLEPALAAHQANLGRACQTTGRHNRKNKQPSDWFGTWPDAHAA